MGRHSLTAMLAGISAAALCLAAPISVRAQYVGENVNMVTGTEWPGGDPFLQRQNEPSIAVSSANPEHLFAGANDYRTVDIPNAAADKMAGDAWAGIFKSLDGGKTWKSYLMPGYPQDPARKPYSPSLGSAALPRSSAPPLMFCGPKTLAKVGPPAVPAYDGQCTSAADPVTRAGADGMLYYGGIVFQRGTNYGKVYLARFIDLNNKEYGDATLGTDPLRFIDQKVVATGGPVDFADKPWFAVDVPRSSNPSCTVSVANPNGTTTKRSFPGHTVYATYLRITSDTTTDVIVRHSDDCGATWSSEVKVNDATSLANEGPSLAIDPLKGHVYLTWRRVGSSKPGQTNAIMISRSFSRGNKFTKPRQVAAVDYPFDQGTSSVSFRVTLFPSSAISVDATGARRLHVAWSERSTGQSLGKMTDFDSDARVVVATKLLSPPPVTEHEEDENDSTCQRLDRARKVDAAPITVDGVGIPGRGSGTFDRGHQFMPAITFSQGKLMLVYYDSRLDHTRAYYKPHSVPAGTAGCTDPDGCWTPDTNGSFYDVLRGPLGAPLYQLDSQGMPVPPTVPPTVPKRDTELDDWDVVFPKPSLDPTWPVNFITDWGIIPKIPTTDPALRLKYVRHTVDVRVASAVPSDAPQFNPVALSRFPFGTRGDEGALALDNGRNLTLPGFGDPVDVVVDMKLQRLQQLKVNTPNLPMFKSGSVPFFGDYIDIQGPAFVKKAGKWIFNTDSTPSPVFHAIWTSNEDVRAPPTYDGWSKYYPIVANYDPQNPPRSLQDPQKTVVACDPSASNAADLALYAATRNQNIYTSRITEGLVVSTPQNTKPLDPTIVRSFVVAATNATADSMTATFSYAFASPSGSKASFKTKPGILPTDPVVLDDTAEFQTVKVDIAPHSTVSRTLFVTSTSSTATLTATVTASTIPPAAPATYSGFVLLNPPGTIPGLVNVSDPAGQNFPASWKEGFGSIQVAANLSNANLSNANLSNANLSNANLSNANLSNANLSNANLSNANLSNAGLANLSNANLSNANLSNANLSNANLSNANLSNANLSNANLSNAAISDLNYEYKNSGDTTTSYAIRLVADPVPTERLQLIVAKTYTTPTAVGCAMREEAHNHIQASINNVTPGIVTSDTDVDPGISTADVTNATLTLAPGEKAQITLRGVGVSLARMGEIGSHLTPRLVPQVTPKVVGVTYGSLDHRTSTQTTVNKDGIAFYVTVRADGTPLQNANPSKPIGQVVLVVNDTIYVGIQSFFGGPTALQFDWTPPSGVTVTKATAFYSGYDAPPGVPANPSYTPSNGSYPPPSTSHWTPLAPIPVTMDVFPDRGVAALNGQIFLFGGDLGDGYGDEVHRFDPATSSWAALGRLTQPVLVGGTVLSWGYGSTRAATLDGRVFSVSNWYDPRPDGNDYLSIEEWGATGSLGIVRLIPASGIGWPEAVVGLGGKLHVMGSRYSGSGDFALVVWDPVTDGYTWQYGGMSSGVAGYSAVAANGLIHLLGGAVLSYCTWDYSSVPATCIPHEFPASNVWWTYTPGIPTGTWTLNDYAAVHMPTPRHSLGMAVLGGKIYTIGGIAGPSWSTNDVATVEVFDPVAETWSAADPNTDMNMPRFLHSVVEVGGKIYAIGGYNTPRAVGVFTP